MADLKDLLGSKKIRDFVRKEKSRPWTILNTDDSSAPQADFSSSDTDYSEPKQQDKTPDGLASEIEAKSRLNRVQTEAKPGTEPRPNRVQTEAISATEADSKKVNRGQTEAKPGTEPRPLSRPFRGQTEAKPGTEPRPELRPSPSSSSSSLDLDLNKLTTTAVSDLSSDLPLEWNEIDSGPLSAIRFGRHQLTQLARIGNLTVDQVQDSIYAFAFDLEVNNKGREINGHALNYFMGILRKGPYTPPANYETPEDHQQRLYLDAKEQQRKRRQEVEARLEAAEFEEWAERLSLEQRADLIPPKDFAKSGSAAHTVQLRDYFRENVWPQLKQLSKLPSEGIST